MKADQQAPFSLSPHRRLARRRRSVATGGAAPGGRRAVRFSLVLLLFLTLTGARPVSAAQDEERDPRETATAAVISEPSPTPPPTVAPPIEPPTPTPPSAAAPGSTLPTTEEPGPTPTNPAPATTPAPTGSAPTPTPTATASPSPRPSPLATVPNGAGTLLLSPGSSTSVAPGETVEFVHTLTYIPVANESATVHVTVTGPKGWSLTVSTQVDGPPLVDSDGDTVPDQLTLCVPAERIPCTTDLVVRLSVPADASEGKNWSVVLSVALSREGEDATERSLQSAVTTSQLITATDQLSIRSNLTVAIIEGRSVTFGALSPSGNTAPAPGVTAVPVTDGFQYTYDDAVTVYVDGASAAWTAACYVASATGVMQTLEVSADGETFVPVPTAAPGVPCLSGSGNTTVTLDLRITVTWAASAGPSGGQLVFTIASS